MQTQQLVAAKSPFLALCCRSAAAALLQRKLPRRWRAEKIIQGVKSAAGHVLTILAVSGMLLGGVYVFLVQLAEHGW